MACARLLLCYKTSRNIIISELTVCIKPKITNQKLKGALQSFFSRKATLSIVYIFGYCRYLTCAPRHACVFRCAVVLILMHGYSM